MSDDLVQRLRNSLTPDIWAMRCEAADRIEALETELNDMSDFGKARHDEIVMANKRIEALEAALREIGKTNSYAGIIARRALQAKP